VKKTALAILLFLLLAAVFPARAQDFNFARAYQDYQFSLTTYDQSYKEYTDARDFYLKNQTLTLKEEARKKTLTMLKNRDQLYIVYLTALRMRIVEVKGLTGDEKGGMYTKIDSEVSWYKDHIVNYKDEDLLENLFDKSSESESRYKTMTIPIIYEALYDISLGEEIGIRQDHEAIYSDIKSGVNNPDPFARWFNDIDNTLKILKQNEDNSRVKLAKMFGQSYGVQNAYQNATDVLTASLKPLSQLNEFLSEVLVAINNQTQTP
jgi:hypothetical protein